MAKKAPFFQVFVLVAATLVLFGAAREAAAQNLPGGSWRQSCRNATMQGRDDVRAECRTVDGRWNRTSIDIDRCGRDPRLANRNGELVCENNVGNNNRPGVNLPAGSYRQSCRNARMESRDDLVAECRRRNGNYRYSKIDIDKCRGRDIANDDGHLQCGDYRYGGDYGHYKMPAGSWQQSCRNAHIVRDDLLAECRQRDGDWVRTSIDLDDCRGQQIYNDNGRLRCGNAGGNYGGNYGGGYNNRLPPGSWQQSCRNARFGNDGRFYADCRERNGGWNTDGIDLNGCRGRPVYNEDGKLRC